jgi:hypothetical protein
MVSGGLRRWAVDEVKVMRQASEVFDGMETAVEEQEQAAAEYSGEELSAKLLEPKADISAKAGKMERDAPLFYGTGSNPTLF